MALSNDDVKDIRAIVCDTVWRIVNRASADDPNTNGNLNRVGTKLAAQQQFNSYMPGTLPVS